MKVKQSSLFCTFAHSAFISMAFESVNWFIEFCSAHVNVGLLQIRTDLFFVVSFLSMSCGCLKTLA